MTAQSGFCGIFQPVGPARPPPVTASARAWGPNAALGTAGTLSLAWHGELYNLDELRRQLDLAAATPLPQVVLAAWQRWSTRFPHHLDGIYALALRTEDGLLVYRDPSGLRNLYHHTAPDGQVACATDLGSLLGLPGVPRRLAQRSLHEYLRFLDIAAPNTWFEDVRALEAGLAAHWPADGGDAHAWPAPDGAATAPASFDEAVERLDTLLQRSVRTRLADAARPAAFLSGGVDSALLCALAARQRGDTTAVTVGFEGAAYDEAPVARRIARHLGLAHEVLRFGRADYLAALERYSLGAEQPMADPAVLATVLAFEHCHSRHDIALDGTGADEAVGLLPPRHVRLAVGYASMLPRGARGRLTRWLRAVPGLAAYAPIVDFEHPADTMIRWHGFTRPEIEALCGAPVSFAQTQFYRTFQRFPRHAHFERYGALLNAMPCDRLNQAMLSSGMPVRFPFWDAATDRYLRQLRTDYRYLPGQPKRILRALLARYIPPQIWDGPKHGFNFPLGEFLAADDFALVRRNLDGDSRRLDRILAPDRVQSYARQFIAGDARLTFRIWALVILGAWLEKHDELH